jgi:hypothetical protein
MAFPVTATRDSTWIATKALVRLGKASVDNPPSADDLTLFLDGLDALADTLAKRGIVYVADLDSVPSGIADELASALAIKMKPDMGDDSADGEGLPPILLVESNLRRMGADAAGSFGPQQVQWI